MRQNIPLCVDLDGTFVKTDTLFELLIRAIKYCPWILFILPFYLFRGRTRLKSFLAKNCTKHINYLPINEKLLTYIKEQKSFGRKIYLVTAANEDFAKYIADKFEIFDDTFGSTTEINLKGKTKANFLKDKFGENGFIYAGNDSPDLEVWKFAKEIIIVKAPKSLIAETKKRFSKKNIIVISENSKFKIKKFFKLIRLHQWTKNILIFVPLVMSHTYTNFDNIKTSILAFFAFSFCASATYIFNDIIDIENDRTHKSKKHRPLASGSVSLPIALLAIVGLSTLSIILTLIVSYKLLFMLFIYVAVTLSYSFILKKVLILDILILSSLYAFRIYFGAIAISEEVSFWLASFSIFIFLSLGALKRYIEASNTIYDNNSSIKGRGYLKSDSEIISTIGITSGMFSVLLYIMYIETGTAGLYETPHWLMFGCIPMTYFISKIWIMAKRGKVHDDPIVYAIKTKENYAILLVFVILFFASNPIVF